MIAMAHTTARKRSHCRILFAERPPAPRSEHFFDGPESWKIIGGLADKMHLGQAIRYVREFDDPTLVPLVLYIPRELEGDR